MPSYASFLTAAHVNNFPWSGSTMKNDKLAIVTLIFRHPPIEALIVGDRSHSIYDPFLVFEGKRLPAPSADREKGVCDGI